MAGGDKIACAGTADEAVPGMPEPGEPLVVTIVGVDEELVMIVDVDGVAWLVPGYTFLGDDDGRYSVPAIPDDLVDLLSPSPAPDSPVGDTVRPAPGPVGPADGSVERDFRFKWWADSQQVSTGGLTVTTKDGKVTAHRPLPV